MIITPFTAVARENKISSNLKKHPDVAGLIAQLRVVINEILQKYGDIQVVVNLCYRIMNVLNSFGVLLYCVFLAVIFIPLWLIWLIISLFGFGNYLWIFIVSILSKFNRHCISSNTISSILPFKSIFTLRSLIDESELLNECPCLKE